jgi:hypothetical protein
MVRTTGDDQPSAGGLDEREGDAGQEHHHGRRAQVISSTAASGLLDSGTCRALRTITITATGMLMKKIHRQEAAEMR